MVFRVCVCVSERVFVCVCAGYVQEIVCLCVDGAAPRNIYAQHRTQTHPSTHSAFFLYVRDRVCSCGHDHYHPSLPGRHQTHAHTHTISSHTRTRKYARDRATMMTATSKYISIFSCAPFEMRLKKKVVCPVCAPPRGSYWGSMRHILTWESLLWRSGF